MVVMYRRLVIASSYTHDVTFWKFSKTICFFIRPLTDFRVMTIIELYHSIQVYSGRIIPPCILTKIVSALHQKITGWHSSAAEIIDTSSI